MKTLFIEARKEIQIDEKKLSVLDKLPEKIGLLSSVQYISILDKIKKYLEKNGKKVFLEKGRLKYACQVLGCDISAADKIKNKVNAFLFIGNGKFHAISIALLEKPVFTFNPEHYILDRINEGEINELKLKKKSALLKFLSADKIGIIVSTKPGQSNMKEALKIKQELEKKGKKAFIFACDNIDVKELENFDCDAWLNTACQALHMEPLILNISDFRKV